jgi:endonuclease/exonuclease/phosphatase family metal-dependent hydrolase
MPDGMEALGTNYSRTKTFDKIARLPRKDFIFEKRFGMVPFGEVLYKEDGQKKNAARSEISDHLPLWAEFRINELTQKLRQIINR